MTRTRLATTIVAAGLLLVACAGDDAQPTVTESAAPTETGPVVTLTAVDYAYEDPPAEITAGTRIALENTSEAEVHEVLALRVADGEDRSAQELLSLPPEELMQVVEVRGAAMAPPGGSSADTGMPPLVVEQPGRYLFACLIPTGAPPEEVLQAAQEFARSGATEGEPDYPQTGPPHAANGMVTEVTVTAG